MRSGSACVLCCACLRVCRPSPHISIWSLLVSTLRQNAAGAFSRPPCKNTRGAWCASANRTRTHTHTCALDACGCYASGRARACLPGAEGSVDVVEASDARLHAKVGAVVLRQLLGRQLLQAVRVLRLRWAQSSEMGTSETGAAAKRAARAYVCACASATAHRRGPRVGLLQACGQVRRRLRVLRVDAGAGGVEKAARSGEVRFRVRH